MSTTKEEVPARQSVEYQPEAKVLRQFRLSEAEDDQLLQLQRTRGDRHLIATMRWLLSLVPGLLSGKYGIDPTDDPRGQMNPEQIAGQWQAVVDALDAAASAWPDVSPEGATCVDELRADAQRNVAHWRARAHGLDNLEAGEDARQTFGRPLDGRITYDPADDDEGSQ